MMTCPKCKAESGDDWSQCKGRCPMPGSPHYSVEVDIAVKSAELCINIIKDSGDEPNCAILKIKQTFGIEDDE